MIGDDLHDTLSRHVVSILPNKKTPDMRPVRLLTRVFHFLCIFACCNLSGVYRSEAAIPFEDGVVGAADFLEERHGWVLPIGIGEISFLMELGVRYIYRTVYDFLMYSKPSPD
jgi:hypothetical protein